MAVGPRAEAQEPFSRAQWGGTDRLGETREVGWKGKIPQSKGKVLVQILPLLLTSHEAEGRLLRLSEPQFFHLSTGANTSHPEMLGKGTEA